MGKVKRGRKYRNGHWEVYSWICVECGREWGSKNVAQDCERRGHINRIMSCYHDSIEVPMNLENYLEEQY